MSGPVQGISASANPRIHIGANFPPPIKDILAEKYASLLEPIETIAELADDLPAEFATPDDVTQAADIAKEIRRVLRELEEARDKEGRPYLEAKREVDAFFSGKMLRLQQSKRNGPPGIMDILQERADKYQRKVDAQKRAEAEVARQKAREAELEQLRAAEAAKAAAKPIAAAAHVEAAKVATVQVEAAIRQATAPAADLTRVRSESGAIASAASPLTFEITDLAKVDLEMLRPYLKREWIEQAIRAWMKKNDILFPEGKQEAKVLGYGVKVSREVKARFS